MKFKLIYLICLICCVLLTFSTVSAVDLDGNLVDSTLNHLTDSNLNQTVHISQSESSKANLNEKSKDIGIYSEDQDCVETVNELDNLDLKCGFKDISNEKSLKSNLNYIDSDEYSLKSSLSSINSSNVSSSSGIILNNNIILGDECMLTNIECENSQDLCGLSDCVNSDSVSGGLTDISCTLNNLSGSSNDISGTLNNVSDASICIYASSSGSDLIIESDLNSNYENSKNQLSSNELEADSSKFSDLQTLINNANAGSTINLGGKTFVGNGTPIGISKAITINGGSSSNPATLDAKNILYIFHIVANNVKIYNCIFINSYNAAVFINASNSRLVNCSFKDNRLHLQVCEGTRNCLISDCNFTNGNVNGGSTVCLLSENTTVRRCNFVNNTAGGNGVQGHGAALQIGASMDSTNTGYIYDCNFINNTVIATQSATHAGALCFRPGIKVYNTKFINNYCNKVGGATTLHSDGELINCTFINNRAGEYGGAVSTGFITDDISVNITNCTFINNSAPMGGAIQIKGNNVKVTNSIFKDNKANESDGGAVYIVGKDAIIYNSTFENNYAKNVGAGVLINGSKASILNSSFDKNIADFGAGVYVIGSNANIFSSNFTNHDVKNGSVYIKGIKTYVYDCNFINNTGENGAGLLIEGSNTTLVLTNFTNNNVTKDGGAVYIVGSNALLIASNFLYNNAIPSISDISSGLGGAVYIRGNNNTIDSSVFNYNTARNGSAIYTDGVKMTLSNTHFDKNQAWSYVLDSRINPSVSYFNRSDILIDLTLVGGNNIANAIYNTASINDIYFYNVSYYTSKGQKVTGSNEIHPVNGAENSNNGSLLYQDDREDNQLVQLIVYNDDGRSVSGNSNSNLLYAGVQSASVDNSLSAGVQSPSNSNSLLASAQLASNTNLLSSNSLLSNKNMLNSINPDSIILNQTFTTGILGNVSLNLSSYAGKDLPVGKYRLYAEHYEDDYYKEIDEANQFQVLPLVDLSIDIVSPKDIVEYNRTNKFTIKITNNGPNNATGVYVNAKLPEGLVFVSSNPSVGTYNASTGIWTVGNLNVGENQTLSVNTRANATGLINYPVNVSSTEKDIDESNNRDNKSVKVPKCDLAIEIRASSNAGRYGEIVNWTVDVANNGPDNASKVIVELSGLDNGDLIYLSSNNTNFNVTDGKLEISKLAAGEHVLFTIETQLNASNRKVYLNGTVSSYTYETNLNNNHDYDFVSVASLCDVGVDVSVSKRTANANDTVKWTIKVSNYGPDKASKVNVSVTDLNSLGLVFINSSDGNYSHSSNLWYIGDLNSGSSRELVIYTRVNSSNRNILLNAIVNTSTYELNKVNNVDNDTLRVNPLCDVMIDVNASKNAANNSDIVYWTFYVLNNGPDTAKNVNVSISRLETLGLIILNSSQNFSNCQTHIQINNPNAYFNQTGYIWTIGDLASGNEAVLTVKTQVNCSNKNILVEGIVNTTSFELNRENNIDCDLLSVRELCDLAIDVNVSDSSTNNNDKVNWTIKVMNNGPDRSSNVYVMISDLNSLGLLFVNSSNNTFDLNSYEWLIGDLANGESVKLIITTQVNRSNETIVVEGIVNTSTFELNKSNNIDNDSLKVNPLCDLTVDINVSESPVNMKDIVNWTVVVKNEGPDGASDVELSLTDLESLGLNILNVSNSSFDRGTYKWFIGDLDNNENASLIITTQVNRSNTRLNVEAIVNSSTYELNRTNNMDNDSLAVNPLCDLIVDIGVSRSPVNKEDVVNWTIVVKNNGPDDASNVVVDLIDLKTSDLVLLNSSSNRFNNSTYKWVIGNLAHNKSVKLVISTRVNTSNETINVDAIVNSSTYELIYTNNVDNDSLVVKPLCDLIVDISVSGSPVNKEDIVNWTVVVRNAGPDDASNVIVDLTDLRTGDLVLLSSSSNKFNNSTYKWNIGDLAHNKSTNLVITTRVNTSNETVNVDAVVNSSTFELNYGNNVDNDSLTVNPLCDLIVDINVSRSPVNKEDVVNWTIVVKNNGPDDASNVVVDLTDLNINDLIIINSSSNKFNNSSFKWIIGDLAHNKSANLVITTRVNCSNETVNVDAVVNSSTFELNRSNNIDNDSLVVDSLCDLAVNITVSRNPLNKEDVVNWTVVVRNAGPDDASNVIVDLTDLKTTDLVLLNSSSNKFNNNTYKWTIGNLAHNKSANLVITTRVNCSNETVNVDAVVNSSTFELNYGNNVDNDSLKVNPLCDLLVDIDVSRSPVNKEDIINWTVVVRNAGPDDASNVIVDLTDLNITDLIIINSSSNKFNNSSFKWIIGDLAHNKSANLVITTRVNCSNETLNIDAVVNSSTFELNRSNNIDNDSLKVNPLCDLIVDISVSRSPVNREDVVNWTVVVRNAGPDDASNVIVDLTDLKTTDLVLLNSSSNKFNNSTYKWTIGNLAHNKSTGLVITTKVNTSNETLNVDAVVNSSTFELNYANNVDNDSLAVNPLCDLIVDISVSGSPVNKEDIVNWTIVVMNNGPDDASNVVVDLTDLNINDLIIVNSSSNKFNNSTYKWIIGGLAHNKSVNLVITTKVNTSNETVNVDAVVNSSTFELNYGNNVDTDSLAVNPLCDLIVDIGVSRSPVNKEDVVNWTIVVRNAGPDDASNVVVDLTDLNINDLIIVNSSNNKFNNSTYKWTIGDLAHNRSVNLVITTRVNTSNETLNIGAVVNSSTFELNRSNNIDNGSLVVNPLCDLIVDINVSGSPVNKEDIVNWTIVVKNNGPDDASNVVVDLTDLNINDLIIVNSSSNKFNNSTYKWVIGDLAHNKSVYLVITTKVNTSNETVNVDAVVNSSTFELNYYNNIDNDSLAVNPLCDLIVDIDVSRSPVNKEDVVNWTIVVRNAGPDDASNVVVDLTDLNTGDLIILNSSNNKFNNSTFKWIVGDLAHNKSVNLIIITRVITSNETIDVEAVANTTTFELNRTNNIDNDSLAVNPLCDIVVDISIPNAIANAEDLINFTIIVKNDGPDDASNVSLHLTDLESLGLRIINVSDNGFNKSSYEWFIGDLANGGSSTLIVTTRVNCSNETLFVEAVANSSTYELNTKNNVDNVSLIVNPLCDLIVDINVSGSPVNKEDIVHWTIVVRNAGPDDANGVYVTLSDLRNLGLIILNSSSDMFNQASYRWFIGDLNHGESTVLIITTKVYDSNRTITVQSVVDSDTFELNRTNNMDKDDLKINPLCDLAVDISVSSPTANMGDILNWTIVIRNDGPDDASGVILNLSNLESLNLTILNVSDDMFNKSSSIWNIGGLNHGDSVVLNIVTNVSTSNETLNVKAVVDGDTYELNKANNVDEDYLIVYPACDLVIDISVSKNPANSEDTVNWTIVVRNDGPDDASKVMVNLSDLESMNLIITEVSSDNFFQNSYEWYVGDLVHGHSANLTISTKVDCSNVTIPVDTSVSSRTFELNMNNNFDNETLNVNPLCDLSVDISVSNGTANKEDIINWTIVIRNDGPDIAQNISLNISNLEDLGLIIKNSSNDTFNGSNWFIDSLSPGESVELIIVTQTNVSNVSIPVEVTVESDTYELNKKNNIDNESLYVNPLCDVAIEITVSNSTVNKGDTVEWTIVVYNNGPDIASDVRVSLADLEALGLIVLNVSYGSVENMNNASSANGNVLNASNSGVSALGNGSGSLLSTGSSSGSLLSSSPSSGSLLSTGSALSTGSNTNPNDSSAVLSTRDLSSRGLYDLSEVNSSNQSNSANLSELNSSDSSSLLIQNSSVSVEEDSNSSDSDVNDFNNSDENNVSANVTAGSNSSDVNVSANVTAGSNSSDVNNSLDSKDDSSLKANTFDNATNGWYIGDLTNENTISLKLSTEVNKSNDNITVPATVNTSTYEIDKSNNFDDDLVKSRPVCDLEVNIFPNEDVFNVGDVVDWFVTVKNNGPDNASDVNVYNTLPKGLKFIGYDLDKGILENISGYSKTLKFRWNIGDLAVNESVVLVLSTKALKEGVVFNNVTVNSSTMDSDESNNYDFAFVEVIPLEEVPELENNTIDNKSNKTGNLDNDINNDVGGSVDSKAASIPMKKTGNPFAILVLIVFALFTLNFRRIRL